MDIVNGGARASGAEIDFVNYFKHGPMLGTIDMSSVFGEGAVGRVYWIGDHNFVGVLYPDKARMTSCTACRITPQIAKRFDLLKAGKSLLTLGNRPKPKLAFKPKVAVGMPKLKFKAKAKPTLKLKEGKPKLAPKGKPKFSFKRKK